MIKSLLILLLAAALVIGSMLSRPSESSFQTWFRDQEHQQKENFLQKLFTDSQVDAYLKDCTYKNRLLWADIDHKGTIVYSGVFNHWFAHAGAPTAAPSGSK